MAGRVVEVWKRQDVVVVPAMAFQFRSGSGTILKPEETAERKTSGTEQSLAFQEISVRQHPALDGANIDLRSKLANSGVSN